MSVEQQKYERMDRHVRTSASVRELMRWGLEATEPGLSPKHRLAIHKEIAKRLRNLTEEKR